MRPAEPPLDLYDSGAPSLNSHQTRVSSSELCGRRTPEAADTQKGPRPPACGGEWVVVREGFGGHVQADGE